MAATNKDAFFKKNPGGANAVNLLVLPAANGTWANFVTNLAATQLSATVAAGYLGFDAPNAAGAQQEYRVPVFTGP